MTNDTKRLVACILFGLAAAGCFLPSYLHVAAYFGGAVPVEWAKGQYVAALALDLLAVACGYGLILTAANTPGRAWLHVGLWAPVILSVWVNWRYVEAHPVKGAYALDPYVSACLPVLLVIATHGLAAVLRAIPADAPEAEAVPTVPVAADRTAFIDMLNQWNIEDAALPGPQSPAVTPPKPAPKARKAAPAAPAVLAAKATVQATGKLPDGFSTQAALAKHLGIDPARVSEWKREIAHANGASAGAGASGAAGTGVG